LCTRKRAYNKALYKFICLLIYFYKDLNDDDDDGDDDDDTVLYQVSQLKGLKQISY